MSFRLLATIELSEEAIGDRDQIFVLRHVVRSQGHAAGELGHEFRPIQIRKRVEFLEQLFGGLRHEIRVPLCVYWAKFVKERRSEQTPALQPTNVASSQEDRGYMWCPKLRR